MVTLNDFICFSATCILLDIGYHHIGFNIRAMLLSRFKKYIELKVYNTKISLALYQIFYLYILGAFFPIFFTFTCTLRIFLMQTSLLISEYH